MAGIAIAIFYANNIERGIRFGLATTMNRVVAAIDASDFPRSVGQPLDDPRYQTPFGGLYWQVTDLATGVITRSRSLWDFELAVPDSIVQDGEPAFLVLAGPAGQTLSALARLVRFPTTDGTATFLAIVAEDREEFLDSFRRFGTELGFALLVLGAALIVAAWLQVRLGLRPLAVVKAGVEAVRSGRARQLEDDYPAEVQPLVGEVNDLLESQEASISFARARASDLAHGLKTPLAVLGTTSQQLRSRGDTETADIIEELAQDMVDRIDHQLRLARLRTRTRGNLHSASVNEVVDRAVKVLRLTPAGEDLFWKVDVQTGLSVNLDNHDLTELLGVVLENAAKWAKSRVAVKAVREDADVIVRIADDGHSPPKEQLDEIGERGHRADPSMPGTGLGLSIAKEIVTLSGGRIAFETSAEGGLLVELFLPAANAAHPNG